MPALIAGIGNADFSGRDLIGNPEKAAVWTSVSAETFLSQKIDGHKSADKKKRNGNIPGRESRPKFVRDQMIRPLRDQRLVFRFCEISIDGRINEHIKRDNERDKDQKPRAKRLRRKPEFLEQPAAEILKSDDVTAPAANESPKDQRRQNRQTKKDKTGIDRAVLERVHRFGRLDRRNRPSRHDPLNDVCDHQQVERDERAGAPAARP